MDLTTISSLGAEALAPLHKMLSEAPPAQRPTILFKAQGAVRSFVSAVAEGGTPVPANEGDPVRRTVFEILTKAAAPVAPPAPAAAAAPEVDELDKGLEELVKAQTAKAKDQLQKGMLSALGARFGVGRAAGMRAMMAGARAGTTRRAAITAHEAGDEAAKIPAAPLISSCVSFSASVWIAGSLLLAFRR
jgi:hypothetical protein